MIGVALLSVTADASGTQWAEFAVYPVDEDQEAPAVDGAIIVWQQWVDTDYDIYGADINDPFNPEPFIVTDYTDDETSPSVFGDIVV
jgi:hypothetical protein